MVAVLTKIFGTEHFDTAEDVVQETLLKALQVWKLSGIPENPSAWLFQVARNKAIDIIRKNKFSTLYDFSDPERKLLTSEYTLSATVESMWAEDRMEDELLQMMFACCDPGIAVENQITLILKTLCGFSTLEIAKAFLTSEEVISKRLYRTKEFFRQHKTKMELPADDALIHRVDAVLNSIYLLFNEGYNSTRNEKLIRIELIEEAIALCRLLTEHPHSQLPQVFALMALMLFHGARLPSRLSDAGEIILLDQQDRNLWSADMIAEGNYFMNLAATGEQVSRYHLEAAIAYEHCRAPDFASTNWKQILEWYDWLYQTYPSYITGLNRGVAMMKVHGPAEALHAIRELPDQSKLESFYLFNALMGELQTQLGDPVTAQAHYEKAMDQTLSETEKRLLKKKISLLGP